MWLEHIFCSGHGANCDMLKYAWERGIKLALGSLCRYYWFLSGQNRPLHDLFVRNCNCSIAGHDQVTYTHALLVHITVM